MLKANSIIILVFVLSIITLGIPTSSVLADDTKAETISKMLEQIKNLQLIIKDRYDFNNTNVIIKADKNRSEDFFLRVAEESASVLYAKKTANIILETDGGVRQILVVADCLDTEFSPIFYPNTSCESQTWVYSADLQDGIKTFTLPVKVATIKKAGEIDLIVFACRFDGCVLETELELSFKSEVEFTDLVKVYDRYEWTYEWDDDYYHVQEVLLNFPYKDIKEVNLLVRCDVRNLTITTTEKDRATCNSKRRYSNVNYRDFETDEQGNVYNLKIESVTRDSSDYVKGAVEMEFEFLNHKNNIVATIYYRPEQKEEETEEVE